MDPSGSRPYPRAPVTSAWRTLLAGTLVGFLLSLMRAPLGLDLVRVPAVDGPTAALFRAAALVAAAAVLGRAARAFENGVRVPLLLVGVAAGLALHGAGLLGPLDPGSRFGFALAFALLSLAVYGVVRRGPTVATAEGGTAGAAPPATAHPAPGLFEWGGLVVAAAGAALALESVAHQVRLLGMGQPLEETLIGLVLVVLLAVGAQAFGAPLVKRAGPALVAACLPLAALACLASVEILHGFEDPRVFETYLRRFGSDFTTIGMLRTTGLLAAVSWIAPGFAGGIALAGARHPVRLAALLLGAAVGIGLRPLVIGFAAAAPMEFTELATDPWAWRSVTVGVVIAGIGGLVALFAGGRGGLPKLGLGLVLVAIIVPFLVPRRTVWILDPWNRAPIEPLLIAATPHGLLTVELARDAQPVLTLDRNRLTPSGAQETIDGACLRAAWELVPAERRASGDARVLLVGGATPGRAFGFTQLGIAAFDRCVVWHEHARAVEDLVFEGEPPPGDLLSPAGAKARIATGTYDLVVALPTYGHLVFPRSAQVIPRCPAPGAVTAGIDAPAGTVAVAWFDAGSPLVTQDLGERVLWVSDGIDDPYVGVVRNALTDGGRSGGSGAWDATPLEALVTRAEARADPQRAALFGRLARGASADGDRALYLGLHHHFAAQVPSSPFESAPEQVELDGEALSVLGRAAEASLDPFLRDVWEGLARLLAWKRMPDLVLEHVEPLTQRHAPWPDLERVVATAYHEFGMPAEAAAALERAILQHPYDLDLRVECAAVHGRAGQYQRAAVHLRAALGVQPGREDLERRLAIVLLRAGDPEGRTLAQEILARDPDDEELAELLLPGAAPPPESVFGPPPGMGPRGHDHGPAPEIEPETGVDEHDGHDHGSHDQG